MNLKQITKQLSKLAIMLALLLVPTIATTQSACSQIVAERIQPTQILKDKTCQHKLKYSTADIYNMVSQCFDHLNLNSIQMFGAPIIPIFGVNQCVCITEKIRKEYECTEDYMAHVIAGTAAEILGEYSKQCILEGAMGDEARKAYIGGLDNSTKKTPPIEKVPTPKKDEVKNDQPKKENKNPITWDDLINK